MEFTEAAKRKKRKTRKYLDEIWRKSRKNSYTKDIDVQPKAKRIVTERNTNYYLTSSRLTLAKFPKVVQSKTITRDVLSEVQNEINFNSHSPDNLTEDSSPKNIQKIISIQNNKSVNGGWNSDISIDNGLNVYKELSDKSSSTTIAVIPPPVISQRGRGNSIYKQFVNDFSISLANHGSTYDENIITKFEQSLDRISLECHKKLEDKVNNINNEKPCYSIISSRESIIQNPTDYLRQRCKYQECTSDQNKPTLSRNISISPPCPSTCKSTSSQNTPIQQESPDFEYYPHKLNE